MLSITRREAESKLNKIIEVNLEYGSPTVEQAIFKLKNTLLTHKGLGGKAAILVHGYGSTGVGGSIKTAVHRTLRSGGMSGIVRIFVSGAEWTIRKKELLAVCPGIAEYERRVSGNEGVTVVILR